MSEKFWFNNISIIANDYIESSSEECGKTDNDVKNDLGFHVIGRSKEQEQRLSWLTELSGNQREQAEERMWQTWHLHLWRLSLKCFR